MKCSLLTLSCYVDAELPAPRKGELEAHLVGCHRCRSGLGHLREEVERVEGLARVHLPEGSVRLLLEHTGLIAAGDPMPAIPDAGTATGPSPTTPPWLRGGAGAALPWASARPTAPPRRPGGPPAPGGPVEPAAGAPSTPDTFDVFAARTAPPAPAVPEPRVDRALTPLEVDLPEPALEVDLDEQVIAAADAEPWTQTEAEPPPEAAAPPREGPLARRRARIETRRAAAAAEAEAAALAEAEAAAAEVVEPAAVSSFFEVPQEELAGSASVVMSSASEPDGFGPEIAAAAVPPGGDAVPAVWTPESSVEAPPAPKYPLTDDDALDAPSMVERFGPLPAPKPTMLDRVREKLALRRALRVAALDDGDDGIEIVSGPGAPARAPRSRADLARRRNEALRPAAKPDGSVWTGEDDGDPMAVPELPTRREPTVDELLAPPARPSSLPGATPLSPPAPPPAVDDELDDPDAWHPIEPEVAPASARRRRRAVAAEEADVPVIAAASGQASAAARTVDGRRLTVVLGAAILLMFIVGVASARSTTPLPPSTGAGQAGQAGPAGQAVQPPANAAPEHPSVVQPPAGPPHAAVVPPPPPVADAPPAGLTGTVTLGDGGTGWSVKDIRYGAHAGYLRMVLDFIPGAGAASGTPKVTIGFQDPTTLIITLDQVTAAGAPAAPGPGSPITSISLQSPPPATGSTAYVIKLAHAIQFTPSFASSPLRLIVDLH